MKEMPDNERLLTFSETLAHLRISKSTLYRFMQSGELQGYKVGSTWRFYHKDVQGVIKARNGMGKLDTRGEEMVKSMSDNEYYLT